MMVKRRVNPAMLDRAPTSPSPLWFCNTSACLEHFAAQAGARRPRALLRAVQAAALGVNLSRSHDRVALQALAAAVVSELPFFDGPWAALGTARCDYWSGRWRRNASCWSERTPARLCWEADCPLEPFGREQFCQLVASGPRRSAATPHGGRVAETLGVLRDLGARELQGGYCSISMAAGGPLWPSPCSQFRPILWSRLLMIGDSMAKLHCEALLLLIEGHQLKPGPCEPSNDAWQLSLIHI